MIRSFFIITSLILSLISTAQQYHETEFITVNGLDRYYKLFVPKNYSEEKKYPLLFVLHGGGGCADRMARSTGYRFNQLADHDDFIVVYPNGYKKGWNDSARDTLSEARRLNIDDVAFFKSMIDDLNQKLSIDNPNIFVCGISNGGFMAQRLAFEFPGKIRGIAVVAATLSIAQKQMPPPEHPVSVLFMCGTSDPLVPYAGGDVTVFRQKRGEVLSVAESLDFWKTVNGCTLRSEKFSFPDKNKRDKCVVQKTVWVNPVNPKLQVVDVSIENGGHSWPGTKQYLPKVLVGNTNRDINGCDEVWAFFKTLME